MTLSQSTYGSEVKTSAIKNIIRTMSGYYTKISDDRVNAYAGRLIDYPLTAITDASRRAVDEMRMFPSMSEFLDLVRIEQVEKEPLPVAKQQLSGAEKIRCFKAITKAFEKKDTGAMEEISSFLNGLPDESCRKCTNSGYVSAARIGAPKGEVRYSFKCNCKIGLLVRDAIPLWSGYEAERFSI